ncbi:hypothetical protein N5W20_02675 [Candidatus Kirkpatrickella diaphorinae]|uniref:Uncharacterized protein n=1 Tax=Candidatus Kirkpatrickella diaphorinae TaxID=2984322 RepID=A0ABY6GJS3_9PROT|nr:hypothetical protein [Candidatus Kirkpatrickella diaphorinae]UYH51785.1 hypothetical protein N5W20_02675 [Candidatus Kirkpatrickella diaphorinae]
MEVFLAAADIHPSLDAVTMEIVAWERHAASGSTDEGEKWVLLPDNIPSAPS